LKANPDLTELHRSFPPLSRVKKEIWDLAYGFPHKFEQFLLKTATSKIIEYENAVKKSNSDDYLRANKQERLSPMITNYFNFSIKEMRSIIKVYNTSYIDEEGDDDDILDVTSPQFILNEMLNRPNPLEKVDFNSKLIREEKLSVQLIETFILSEYNNLVKDYDLRMTK